MAGAGGERHAKHAVAEGAKLKKGRREYEPGGTFKDAATQTPGYVELVNRTEVVIFRGNERRRVAYPNIVQARQNFMGRGLEEARAKIERRVEKALNRTARRTGW